jgi:hypothetical protein
MQRSVAGADSTTVASLKRSLWIVLLTMGSIGFSFALACATPFAALAALAALNMPRRDVFSLVALAWFVNQVVGYVFLAYPQTWDSFAWGGAIGIAALLSAIAAVAAGRITRFGRAGITVAVFLAAFVSYELALYAASFVLPTGAEAFSLPVVWRIFCVNVIALAGLFTLYRLGLATGLIAGPRVSTGVSATA